MPSIALTAVNYLKKPKSKRLKSSKSKQGVLNEAKILRNLCVYLYGGGGTIYL